MNHNVSYQNYYPYLLQISKIEHKMKAVLSTQENRYRSVKYRLNRDISMSINEASMDKRINLPTTAKNSIIKSRKNGNKFSVSYLSDFRSSVNNCQSPQDEKLKRNTYMDTFHFLLSMQRNRYNAKQKEREEHQQVEKQKEKNSSQEIGVKLSRVQLPVLNQLDSHFTVLDNINLPINYINQEISRVNKEMSVQVMNVRKIAHQIKQVQKKVSQQIVQIQEIGKRGFEKLWGLLKANRVYQQQQIMKLKSGYEKSKDYLPKFYKQFDKSKYDVKVLQDTIFKGVPFQLEQLKEFEMISTNYF